VKSNVQRNRLCIYIFTAAFVNVGWGKKETQFHGSEGKHAALIKKPQV
jgi:hypothetical protein